MPTFDPKLFKLLIVDDIPVIFLTAKNDVESVVKGFEAGAVDYITKTIFFR